MRRRAYVRKLNRFNDINTLFKFYAFDVNNDVNNNVNNDVN